MPDDVPGEEEELLGAPMSSQGVLQATWTVIGQRGSDLLGNSLNVT